MRSFSIAIVFLASLLTPGIAQKTPERATAPAAVPEPTQLLEQLMPSKAIGKCCESKADRQAAALKALGIQARSAEEVRLVFEDLDGDGVAEALFTVDIDLADVSLVVLKRKANQWYRLPSPPEFSCWCKYESAPLDTFVEIQRWGYDFEKPRQPMRLIFVRGSSGGTGLYERSLNGFALHGFELRRVFGASEERRECSWPEGRCEFQHVTTTVEDDNGKTALVTREFRKTLGAEEPDVSHQGWWQGLSVSHCTAYVWDSPQFRFANGPAATSAYCRK